MDVLMPQLGETVDKGKITTWFKKVGDPVKPGENLFEIETDKVSMEVPSTTTGVLAEIRVEAGNDAPVGAVVAVGIGIAFATGLIPPKSGMEGTIGVAQRVQTDQIAAGDVAIDPAALNDIIQSDVVHRLAKDPEFRKVVADQSFKNTVAAGEFQRLLKSEDFLALLRQPEFAKAMTAATANASLWSSSRPCCWTAGASARCSACRPNRIASSSRARRKCRR